MKINRIKYYLLLSYFILLNKSNGLNIVWNNGHQRTQINSLGDYNVFMDQISRDPRCLDYLLIRGKIARHASTQGALISPFWGIFGAHFIGFQFQSDGWNGPKSNIYNEIKNIVDDRVFCRPKAIKIPNTDLAIEELWKGSNIENPVQHLTDLPILDRANFEEVNNPENKFYALSCTLHGSGIPDGLTSLESEYCHVVSCKATTDDPLTQAILNFEIDDAANFPIEFRTSGGDSCQPFFMITPLGEVKLVGTHNPGGNSFSVQSLCYPSTRAFTDHFILQEALTY